MAIVKKIMEDHHGELTLEDRVGGGAVVSLIWPCRQPREDALSNGQESATSESVSSAAASALRKA